MLFGHITNIVSKNIFMWVFVYFNGFWIMIFVVDFFCTIHLYTDLISMGLLIYVNPH